MNYKKNNKTNVLVMFRASQNPSTEIFYEHIFAKYLKIFILKFKFNNSIHFIYLPCSVSGDIFPCAPFNKLIMY